MEAPLPPGVEIDGRDLTDLEAVDHDGVGDGQSVDALVDGVEFAAIAEWIESLEVIHAEHEQDSAQEDEHTYLDFPAFLHACVGSVPSFFNAASSGIRCPSSKATTKASGKPFLRKVSRIRQASA